VTKREVSEAEENALIEALRGCILHAVPDFDAQRPRPTAANPRRSRVAGSIRVVECRVRFRENHVRMPIGVDALDHEDMPSVDPESIIPLPDKFDMEIPAPDVPPEITRFLGAWIGTWHDDKWWRDEAIIAGGVLTMTGFRTFRYTFNGPDRLYLTATQNRSGGVTSGTLRRRALLRVIDRSIGRGPASESGFRISRSGLPMAHGRSRSKGRSIRPPALARRRSQSSRTCPTSAGIN
jgi:hypothetical protein